MSYQVLARKWRPQSFNQLVGQDHVKTALTHALQQNRLHHAYLFTGTRGVGKTTIARIFAKSLNCEQGVTATPCGVCSACTEIDQGFFVDLLEIDAASRTKVEDTRDLLDNVQYAPTRGRYKVYLIDEVHMLSRHSFNALLKTLEEPPPHVKFLLATTDPQKLPITVLSRCLQFSLKALTQQQIKQHLTYVLAQEQISAEPDALALLARAAKGSLRDSLSLTDQAIAQTNGAISLGAVREMLGYLEQSWAELLLQAVLNRDVAAMQSHLSQLVASHSHYQGVLDDMLALLHLAALSQFQLSASELALTESAFVRAIAKAESAEAIQLYYQLLLSGKKDLPFAPEPRIGLEMALLRAIAFVPAATQQSEMQQHRQAALSAAAVPTPTVAPLPVEHHTEQASTNSASMSVEQGTESVAVAPPHTASSAIETPAVDSLTASILARRLGANAAKKFEAQTSALRDAETAAHTQRREPAVKIAPSASAPVVGEKAQIPTRPEIEVTALADNLTQSRDTQDKADIAKSPDVNADISRAATALNVSQAQDNASPWHADRIQDDDVDVVMSNSAQANVAVVETDPSDSAEQDPDDWQWQQTAAEQMTAQSDMSCQSDLQSQPIRHALLEALPVTENIDFASEEVCEVAETLKDLPPLSFSGDITEENFALKVASQVDEWAHRINTLHIGGLMRLFLMHSCYEINDQQLLLKVAKSQQHLDSERNRAQLSQVLSASFGEALTVQIEFLDVVEQSPQQLQQRIDAARRRYVTQVLENDTVLQALQTEFAAHWLNDSLEVF